VNRFPTALLIVVVAVASAAGGYWYASRNPIASAPSLNAAPAEAADNGAILYYRDPSGAPYWSAEPKKDAQGRDYVPVYADEAAAPTPQTKKPQAAGGSRKILYYRNPMGLPDTSPAPKKDSMGMDYIAVYEGEDQDDGNTVKVSLDRIQRSGVRTEPVRLRTLLQPVRAPGVVRIDERMVTVVTLRAEGYIEALHVNTTGQNVKAGEPLFRLYSGPLVQAQLEYALAIKAVRATHDSNEAAMIDGAVKKLRSLGLPEARINEIRANGNVPRTIEWPSPANGAVIEKKVLNGQRVMPGDELYRIADLSTIWVIAEVSEQDIGRVTPGNTASVTFRAFPSNPVEGRVTFIYPELKPETRTARVRIEVPNPDGRLRADMYADVVVHAGTNETPVVAVPDSAIIDSGTRQLVLIAKGEGRFEPRPVKIGRRGDGYAEILDGVKKDDEIVTTATFLIDAESNLKAALKTLSQPEAPK